MFSNQGLEIKNGFADTNTVSLVLVLRLVPCHKRPMLNSFTAFPIFMLE